MDKFHGSGYNSIKQKGRDVVGDIISMATYKQENGIDAPFSSYYTLNATGGQLRQAFEQAAEMMTDLEGRCGKRPYAVLVGYVDQNGRARLLRKPCAYASREVFEMSVEQESMRVIALVDNDA